MVDQASMNRGNAATRLGRNVSGFAHDLVTLGELQVRLLAVDCQDASRRAGLGIVGLGIGALAALGAVPLVFVTFAVALVELGGWSQTAAFALATVSGLVLGAIAMFFGWRRLLRAGTTFGRSKAEFVQSMKWVKESLRPGDGAEAFTPQSRLLCGFSISGFPNFH